MSYDFDLDQMRIRIDESLQEAGLTARAACINAEISPGYLHSIVKEGRAPSVTKLAQICSANDLSLPYILFGFAISPETQRLVELIESDPKVRDSVLSLLDR